MENVTQPQTRLILFFPTIGEATMADPSQLCPSGVVLPKGYQLKGGERKFIVLRGDNTVALAIGPELRRVSYYHRDILALVKQEYSHLNISGGGSVEFTLSKPYGSEVPVWSAEFSGISGDFGVFDPAILDKEFRADVKAALGMDVHMSWRS